MKVTTVRQAIKALAFDLNGIYTNCADSIIEGIAEATGRPQEPSDLIKLANIALAAQAFLRVNRHINPNMFAIDMIVGERIVLGEDVWAEYRQLPGWLEWIRVYKEYFS